MSSDETPDPIVEDPVEDEPTEEQQAQPEPTPEQRIADLTEQAARARADYQNLQKRVARDAAVERERVKARVLEHFLQVYEYGRMAAIEAEKEPGPLAEGVKMIVREFDRMLESEGVRPIGAVGEAFDASRHEAVGEEPGDGDLAPGAISRVVAPGYLLGDRVLRFARVMVAPAANASTGEASADRTD